MMISDKKPPHSPKTILSMLLITRRKSYPVMVFSNIWKINYKMKRKEQDGN